MHSLSVKLERWSAWAPGVESVSDWERWAGGHLPIADTQVLPDVGFLTSQFRRRLSCLSKMTLKVAHDCIRDAAPVRTVFASRHGELSRTTELLFDLAKGVPISPTGFSMSVHNTGAGLYAIWQRDQSASTAISAGLDTLESAFMEAASLLTTNRAKQVMLVIVDEPLPEPYRQFAVGREFSFAAAFLLGSGDDGRKISLSMTDRMAIAEPTEQHGLLFLRFLLQEEANLVIRGRRLTWIWTADVD